MHAAWLVPNGSPTSAWLSVVAARGEEGGDGVPDRRMDIPANIFRSATGLDCLMNCFLGDVLPRGEPGGVDFCSGEALLSRGEAGGVAFFWRLATCAEPTPGPSLPSRARFFPPASVMARSTFFLLLDEGEAGALSCGSASAETFARFSFRLRNAGLADFAGAAESTGLAGPSGAGQAGRRGLAGDTTAGVEAGCPPAPGLIDGVMVILICRMKRSDPAASAGIGVLSNSWQMPMAGGASVKHANAAQLDCARPPAHERWSGLPVSDRVGSTALPGATPGLSPSGAVAEARAVVLA